MTPALIGSPESELNTPSSDSNTFTLVLNSGFLVGALPRGYCHNVLQGKDD